MGEAVNERIEAIIKLPHPITKKQVQSCGILELPSPEVFKNKAEVAFGDMV